MKTIRYLLDENVDPLFRTELLRHEPELNVRSKFTDKDKLCHTGQYDQRQAKRTLYRTGR